MSGSDWGTGSGLLDLYTGTVEASEFATDLGYRDGDIPQLVWTVTRIENDEGVEVDEITEKFGVGNGYVVIDDGEGVEREDGNHKRKFNKNTRYGILIDRVVKNQDGAFDGLLDLVTDRGNPNQAGVWTGLRFEFERVNASFKNNDGETVEYDFIMPSRYLGVDDNVAAPVTSNSTSSLRDQIEQIAKEAPDYEAFVGQALGVKGVTKDKALVKEISDDSDTGLYATASA